MATMRTTEAGRVYELSLREANEISHALETAEDAGGAIAEILFSLRADCFTWTFKGITGGPAREIPEEASEDELRKAYRWMAAHYDRTQAATRAALVMAEAILYRAEGVLFRT